MEHCIEVILSTDKTPLHAESSKTRDRKESKKDESLQGKLGTEHGRTHVLASRQR